MNRQAGTFEISDRTVGVDGDLLVIAEAGVNHNGDPELAHRLVDAAADAGADAVKFQTFQADRVVSGDAPTTQYQRDAGQGAAQRDMLSALELPMTVWAELARHAAEKSLIFLSTAFDADSLEVLVGLGVDALKIPSGEVDNLSYLRTHAAVGLPVILSTGMATLDEVDRAVEILRPGAPSMAVLHCVTAYPAPLESSNLAVLPLMADRYGVAVGWSDHTIGSQSAIIAASLGASVFERHLTLDRTMDGPDHQASVEPDELAGYIEVLAGTRSALGNGVKAPADVETDHRLLVRRSYHASVDLAAGHVIGADDVELVRPADGIGASTDIVGATLSTAVAKGSPVRATDLR